MRTYLRGDLIFSREDPALVRTLRKGKVLNRFDYKYKAVIKDYEWKIYND